MKAPIPLTPSALFALRNSLGYSQADFGKELARLGGKSSPYSRGYINNLERGSQAITPKIEAAAIALHKLIQGDEFIPYQDGRVQHHPGRVSDGAFYAGESKICKWRSCNNSFLPTSPNQKQCPVCMERKPR